MPDVSQTPLAQIEQIHPDIDSAPLEDFSLLPSPQLGPRELPHSLLVRAFRRRWRLMLVIFSCLGIVGLSLSIIFVHPVYQAVAQLRFVPRPVVDGILTAADARAGYSGYLNTELDRIPHRDIVTAAAAKLNLTTAEVNDLLNRTSTVPQDKGQIVSVVVSDSSPQGLVDAANAIAEAYIALDVRPQIDQHRRSTQQFRDERDRFRRERQATADKLSGRDTDAYIRTLYRRRQDYIQPLADAKGDLDAVKAQYTQAQAQLAALKASSVDSDKVQALLNDFVQGDPLLEMYREIYRTMIASSDQEKLFGTTEIPLPKDFPKAGSNSSSTEKSQVTIIQQIRQGIIERLDELKARALQEAQNLRQAEVAAQQILVDGKDRVRVEKDTLLKELLNKDNAVAQEVTQVRQLSGQIDQLDKLIKDRDDLLGKKAAELLPPAEPVLAGPATVAEKASDLRWFFIVGSLFLSALLALALGSLVEHYDSRLTHAGDIVRRVGIPVLASLPSSDDPQTSEPWLPHEVSMADYVNDQYRNIRTALLFGHAKPPRTIVLTAPTAAETKTTLSVNLAISMARAGRTVLLVDADLNNPALADVFDLPESPGWSDVLRNPASLAQAIGRTRIERLSVMPAGSKLEHLAEFLSSPSCRVLFDLLTQRFEHIIIDAPPLLDCPQGRIIAALADGVICSFSACSTRSGQARRATAILEELGASVIGSVLNT